MKNLFRFTGNTKTTQQVTSPKHRVAIETTTFVAAFFAALLLLFLPFKPVGDNAVLVKLTASGEKNSLAKSSEVWLVNPQVSASMSHGDVEGWQSRNGMLGSFAKQPATLTLTVDALSNPTLELATHEYSGIVLIDIGKSRIREDLYSKVPGKKKIVLSRYVHPSINLAATAGKLFLQFACAFIVLFMLTSFFAYYPTQKRREVSVSNWLWLMYAAPSLLIYTLVLLAFWPGQMSPDSLDQWSQISTGHLSDAHPIMATGFYMVARALYDSPSSAVALQYLFLSIITGFFLVQIRQWGGSAKAVAIAACVFPLFPTNFLIATTLWKDVPYATGLMMLSYGSAELIRNKFRMTKVNFALLGLAGILVVGVRHNGILVSAPFFLLLFLVAPKHIKFKAGILFAIQCVTFLLLKTLVLTVFNVSPIAPQYRAIVGAHVVGAMVAANAPISDKDKSTLEEILPLTEWQSSYRCDTVVPIFWNPKISASRLGEEALAINKMAFRMIIAHPLTYVRHQLCVTKLIWRIRPSEQEWLPISTLEITDVESYRNLDLKTRSKFEELRSALISLHERLGKSAWYSRPAIYLLTAALITVIASLTVNKRLWLAAVPAFLNVGSLIPIIGAQDYRYLWPSVALSILLIFFGLLVPKTEK